jgi:hypothetical protein
MGSLSSIAVLFSAVRGVFWGVRGQGIRYCTEGKDKGGWGDLVNVNILKTFFKPLKCVKRQALSFCPS